MGHKFNYDLMRKRLTSPAEDFHSLGKVTVTPDGQWYVHIDRGSTVLGVAHLDVVLDLDHFYHLKLGTDSLVFASTLDDRLGAHIILDILPQMGITTDVLLTTGEEIGRSTAQYFTPDKDYQWVYQWDRRGTDVVMYQYEDPKCIARCRTAGFRVGQGSYTDIVDLDHLGCKGFNFGTAYYQNHTARCYADLTELATNLNRFKRFWSLHRKVTMDHIPDPDYIDPREYRSYVPAKYRAYTYGTYAEWSPDHYADPRAESDCYLCGNPAYVCKGPTICLWCGGDCCEGLGAVHYDRNEYLCDHCAEWYLADLESEDIDQTNK